MKTLKTLFTLLLMTVSMAVSAQTIVAVEKTDGTTDNYNLADVDSVVYEPVEEVKYYYYAGWTCPKNLTELANTGTLIENYESLKSGDVIKSYIQEPLENDDYESWYIVIPNKLSVVDADGTVVTFQSMNKAEWNDEYTIIKSDSPDFEIGTVVIKVK